MLTEQLDGALQEAETQRSHSDLARKELRQSVEKVKQYESRIEELQIKLQVVNEKVDLEPKVKTPGSVRKGHRNRGSKNSPRPSPTKGTSERGDGDIAGSATVMTEGENLGSSIQGTVGAPFHLLNHFVVPLS